MGLVASFMPKPFSDRTGTGTHVHLSLGDGRTRNLFHDDADRHGRHVVTHRQVFDQAALAQPAKSAKPSNPWVASAVSVRRRSSARWLANCLSRSICM